MPPTTIGPRLGSKNQPVILKKVISAEAEPPAIAKVIQNAFLVPPIIDAQKIPVNKPIPIMKESGTLGSCKKLLKEIARYSLRSTATQKTGSENIKNETNVIE